MKKAFTLVEILICIALFSLLGTMGMVLMSRGASNVARGSFNTIASNQAAFIISLIRSDISRSNINNIEYTSTSDNAWTGSGDFKVVYASDNSKSAVYTLADNKDLKTFTRVAANGRKQTFSEYISTFSITRIEENKKIGYKVEITMADELSNFPIEWNSTIYPPQGSPLDDYWKPVTESDP